MPSPKHLTQLFPPLTHPHVALEGYYLSHKLHQKQNSTHDKNYIYTNFITSLDGRIAVRENPRERLSVPLAVINDSDWRLFQELAAQCQAAIVSGGYIRGLVNGQEPRIFDSQNFPDLKKWRTNNGLTENIQLVVITKSLDLPIDEHFDTFDLIIVCPENVPTEKCEALKKCKAVKKVIYGGRRDVTPHALSKIAATGQLPRTMYCAAGPSTTHLFIEAGLINRFYLTTVGRLLGGQPNQFTTLIDGPFFKHGTADFDLVQLSIDQYVKFKNDGTKLSRQMFFVYDKV